MPDGYDTIGPISLAQGRRGVKASVDGILLARYLSPKPGWRVADLGCGNGFVGLLMAAAQPLCRVTGIEIQDALLKQAVRSARISRLANISFVRADLKQPPWREDAGSFELTVANPPYRKVGTGRLSPDPVRAMARHELLGNAADFARAAAALLQEGGRAGWVYLAEREGDLFQAAAEAGLNPARRRHVFSREGAPPSLVLLESVKGPNPPDLVEEEPLILYETGRGRNYTREAREILYGEKS